MIKQYLLFLLGLLFLPMSSWAGAVITYHGRIVDAAGRPVESSNVTFTVRIYSPNPDKCLLYEESRTLSMSGSDGVFVIPIGDGFGARTATDPGIVMEKVFSNDGSYTFNTVNTPKLICHSGTSYTPNALDQRQLYVSFSVDSGPAQVLPLMDINFVPLAVNSYDTQNVGGTPASSVLRLSSGTATPLSTANFTELLNLLNGSSSHFEKAGELGGVAVPVLANGQVLGWNGGWTGVTPLTSYTETDPMVKPFAKADLPTCTANSFLKDDGNGNLICASVNGANGGTVTSVTAGTGLKNVTSSGNPITVSGTLAVDVGTGANQIVQLDGGGKLPVLDGSQLSNVTASALSSTASINTSGAIATTGSLSGQQLTTTGDALIGGNIQTTKDITAKRIFLYDHSGSGPGSIGVQAPSDIAGAGGTSYILTLPENKGTAGQVLAAKDSNGVLEWISPNSGSVASVTAAGTAGNPLIIGGTATAPTLDIPVANGTTNGYLSSADWTTFNSKQVAGSYITSLNGDVTSSGYSAGSVTASITNNAVTSSKIADGAVGQVTKIISSPGSAGTNRLIATDTTTGTTVMDFYCSTVGHILKWTGTTGFGCAALSSADIPSLDAAKITSGTFDTARLGTGTADNTKYLRGDGTWQTLSTSDATKLPLGGGQMSGAIDMNGNKIVNVTNIPFVAAAPSSGQNGQSLRWNNTSSQWEWFTAGESGAGVLSVSSANSDISISGTTNPILTLNSGTSGGAGDANKIAKLDGSGKISSGMLPSIAASNITGTIGVANGGTGQTSYAIGDLLYASSPTSLSKLAAGTNGYYLKSNGPGVAPSWESINSGTVTSVSAAATAGNPLVVGGTSAAPTLDLPKATSSANGYLSSADWTTFNSKQAAGNYIMALTGDVTSSGFSSGSVTTTIANNAVTSSKIADGAVASLAKVVASPGSAGTNRLLATDATTGTTINDFYCTTVGHVLKWTGTTGFGCASLVSSDIANFNADVDARITAQKAAANGIASLNANSRVPVAQLGSGTANNTKVLYGDGTWGDLPSGGTVTSVGLSLPSIFSVTNSPVTNSGTLTASLASQAANTFLAAPDGTTGAPTFRTIASADLPTISIAKGGTGATTAAAARTNLELGTAATVNTGSAAGNIPVLGTGGLSANKMCTADGAGSGVICTSSIPTGSQWVTAGSDISYSTGNVGIGMTANSFNRLSVNNSGSSIKTAIGVANLQTPGAVGYGARLGFMLATSGSSWSGYTSSIEAVTEDASVSTFSSSMRFNNRDGGADREIMRLMPGGNVGIGTTNPTAKLDVVGQMRTQVANAGAPAANALTVNWNNSNIQYTSGDCGGGTAVTYTMQNLLDGGVYTLVMTGTNGGTCTFTDGTNTYKFPATGSSVTSGKMATFSFLRVGSNVFISWTEY
ncbi:MAG: hypothetical protein OM95_14885 [Bdellovibrio sp. ArHS]|uniref:beta strand repeat-containing protein n=1 Tax=Bdellovibrio sp. ArHS TaxID=1569284 RepID=UPI0005833DB1|nr:hypothetical protein [Bdellovibrio sp. ArHS]KHD87380.1 MAG: hypothetical protein OM95_14885 [Bdellovibrio sp. ArHS]